MGVCATIWGLGSKGCDTRLLHGFHQDQRDEEAEEVGAIKNQWGRAHPFNNKLQLCSQSSPSSHPLSNSNPSPLRLHSFRYRVFVFNNRVSATGEEELLQLLQLLCQGLVNSYVMMHYFFLLFSSSPLLLQRTKLIMLLFNDLILFGRFRFGRLHCAESVIYSNTR